MKMHVVMKERQSAIMRFLALPHEIYTTKKEAGDRVEELNSKSTTNIYWVEPARFVKHTNEESFCD
jgi:hypothetical protein